MGLPNSPVKLVGRLEVRDADTGVITSTDEDYHDRGNQNRDDRSEESRSLVEKIGANPDPLQIGTVQPIANNGIVWILPNGDVIIGNHRVNGVRLGYEKGTAEALEKFVREDAAKRGIEIGADVKKPLLVFVLERIESPDGKADEHEVVRLANESQNRGFNVREQASNDAKILIDNNLLPQMAFRADGRIDETKSGDAIGKFRQESGAQGLVAEDGSLTEEGQTRIQNAALAALLGGEGTSSLLQKIMSNAGRLDMASELRALMKMTPELMALAEAKPGYDLRAPLAEALQLFAEWRDKDETARLEKGKTRHDWRETAKDGHRVRGLSWEAYLSQGDMFRQPSKEAKILGDLFARAEALRSFDREDVESAAGKKRVVDLVSDYLADYIQNARAVNTETDDMFGGTPASRADVMSAQRQAGGADGGPRFSVNPNLLADIDEALKKDAQGRYVLSGSAAIQFSEPSRIMQFLGIDTGNIFTVADVVQKMERKHKLQAEQIADLPRYYDDPAAVFVDIDGKGANVLLTELRAVANDGTPDKPVMVLLRPSKRGDGGYIASAYPRDVLKEQSYIDWLGRLRYLNENKIAGLGLEVGTVSRLQPQASGDDVKTAEDFSKWSMADIIPQPTAESKGVSAAEDAAHNAAQGGGARFSVAGVYTGSAANYANRSRQGGVGDGPSVKHIGTGEGSQVYGWGLYGSTVRGVAEWYARGAYDIAPFENWLEQNGATFNVSQEIATAYQELRDKKHTVDFVGAMKVLEDKNTPGAKKAHEWATANRTTVENLQEALIREHLYEQTFFTNRAPGDESHLLKWYEPVSEEQMQWVEAQLEKEGYAKEEKALGTVVWTRPDSKNAYPGNVVFTYKRNALDAGYTDGEWLYEKLARNLRNASPQAASEFLYRAGIDGVKYPVDSYGGKTVKDGGRAGWNYVAFSDEHVRVDHKWTDGQMRYSVAARLDEERRALEAKGGRLLLAHHGTSSPGFTVFGKSSEIGFFFARSRNTAASYIRTNVPDDADVNALHPKKIEDERHGGIYDVALRMENPYVIDCKGANWDRIAEESGIETFYRKVACGRTRDGGWYVEAHTTDGAETVEAFGTAEEMARWTRENIGGQLGDDASEAARRHADDADWEFPLVDDRDGHYFASLDDGFPGEPREGQFREYEKTRDVVARAFDEGCDGVIFRNVVDDGGGTTRQPVVADDVYVVKESRQVKAVDEMTYADDGSIVPAEERLDWSNPDIRFSTEGLTDEQRKNLSAAQTEAQRVLARVGGTELGRFINKEFAATGRANLIGRRISSARDLAALAQIYRNPCFETFRYFFTKSGEVVWQTGVTSRLPGAANVSVATPKENTYDEIARMAEKLEPDGVWLLHNHPSGNVSPSQSDVDATNRLREHFGALGIKLGGHVIIDHDAYAELDERGNYAPRRISAAELDASYHGDPFTRRFREPGEALGPGLFAKVALALQRGASEPGKVLTLVSVDARGYFLTGIANIPAESVADGDGIGSRFGELDGFFADWRGASGAGHLVVVGDQDIGRYPAAVQRVLRRQIAIGNATDFLFTSADGAWDSVQSREPVARLPREARNLVLRRTETVDDGQTRFSVAAELVDAMRRRAAAQSAQAEGAVLPWPEDFPKVMLQTTLANIKQKWPELHTQAKAGSREAALELVRNVLGEERVGNKANPKWEKLRALADAHPDAIVVPVHAEEATGRNKIPMTYARMIEKIAGLRVEPSIVQSVRAHHTGANAVERMTRRAAFDGPVQVGAEYILVDDHVTQGGTLNELRKYIQSHGGKVVAVTTLTASQFSDTISISRDAIQGLYAKYGSSIDEELQQAGIANGVAELTQSQARELRKLRADTLRDRLAQARVQRQRELDARAARSSDASRDVSGRTGPQPGSERFSTEAPRFAYPNPLGRLSDDELVAAAVATRIALGKSDAVSDRAVKTTTVQKLLRRLHPDWDTSKMGLESQRVIQDARKFAKRIRDDLDRGVSESLILKYLPESARETFGAEMRSSARQGARLGAFGSRVGAEIGERQAKVVEDAVRVQTGIDASIIENVFGIDLSATLMHLAENPLSQDDGKGVSGTGAGEEENAAPAEEKDVEAKVVEAVSAVVDTARQRADENAEIRSERKAHAEQKKNDGEAEGETGDESGDALPGDAEDAVAVAVKKAGLDLENPRHLAEFVAELTRRYWIKEHELAITADVWRDLVAVQFLRKTAQSVYAKLCRDLVYSRSRETAMQRIARLDAVPTVAGLLSEMEFVGALINAQRIRDTQKEMCEKLDHFLRQKFGAQGRFRPDKEDGKRSVSAEAELRARDMRHAMWLTPDAAADEARRLQETLDALSVDFKDAGRDRDQSREFVETIRKLNVLREFGALRYKSVGEIEAAARWWEDFARGESDDIVREMSDRDIRTKKAAHLLAVAFADPKRTTIREGGKADALNRFITGHMGFVSLLQDCMRHASDADAAAVKDILDYISREVQKSGDRTAAEKRRHNDAFHAAVESIYGKGFNAVMKDMMAPDERFAKYMGVVGGKRVMPTKGRAMQLLVSLLQEGRKVQVEDEDNPGQTKTVWVGGYHDNIVKHHREGQAAEIMRLLTPQDMNMLKWLGQWYEQNRSELSDVSHSIFGIGVYAELPNYFPVKMMLETQGLEKGQGVGWTIFPKALTPRVRNERDFDTSADIFSMWAARMEEAAQWKHHAQLGLEMRGIFGRAELRETVRANHGASVDDLMQGFITDILAGHGAYDRSTAGVQYFSDQIRGWTALCALGGNVGVMLKQTTSIPAFGFEIGLVDTAKHIVTAFTPEGMAAMGRIWNSEQRKTRWQVGSSEVVQNALRQQNAGLLKRLFQASMITNKAGDVVPALVVGQGIYRDCLARGMSVEDAMAETWSIVERTQQSGRMENQTSIQRRNKFGRIMFQFLSTQQQYLQYEARAIREVIARPDSVKRWGALGRAILLNHFILSSAYFWMGELYKACLGQEPPEDELKDWLVTCLLGPYGSLLVAGFMCKATLERAIKGYSWRSPSMLPMESWLKTQINDGARLVEAIFSSEGDTWDEMLDAAVRWMSDSNSTVRDLRKIYRFRVKGEQKK
ncbi:MAG: hypothetical protein IJ829_06720 [Kiritimatiellae bacterium]|nr:hypothetical protein [Kiritimatiellia bacterium]